MPISIIYGSKNSIIEIWNPFILVAGSVGSDVGYGSGSNGVPSGGSISEEPSSINALAGMYQTGSGNITVKFVGNSVEELQSRDLKIDGVSYELVSATFNSGITTAVYSANETVFISEEAYDVVFEK